MPEEPRKNWFYRERRIFERIEAKYPLSLNSAEEPFDAGTYLRDISAGGAKVITKHKLGIFNNIEFWVGVPDGHGPLHFSGRIVWQKDVGKNVWDAGICFNHVRLMEFRRLFNSNSVT